MVNAFDSSSNSYDAVHSTRVLLQECDTVFANQKSTSFPAWNRKGSHSGERIPFTNTRVLAVTTRWWPNHHNTHSSSIFYVRHNDQLCTFMCMSWTTHLPCIRMLSKLPLRPRDCRSVSLAIHASRCWQRSKADKITKTEGHSFSQSLLVNTHFQSKLAENMK